MFMSAISLTHGAIHVAFGFAITDRLALVALGAPLADANEDFGVAILKVHLHGDDRETLHTHGLDELGDLGFVGKQLACASGYVIEKAGGAIGTDVDAVQIERWGRDLGADVPFRERDFALADALDLGPLEHDATFEGVGDLVIEPRAAVIDGGSVVLFLLLCHV